MYTLQSSSRFIYVKIPRSVFTLIAIILLGGFEVNFMDDVGQTLLNWASAFGTLEMVSYFSRKKD